MSSSVVFCDASHGTYSATLPEAGANVPGTTLIYKKTDATTNSVTISGTSGATIDGAASVLLNEPYQSVSLTTNGANWFVISSATTAASFKGARVRLTSNLSCGPSAYVLVPWGVADVDTSGFWSVGSPTRFTIPSGVSRVRLTLNTKWDGLVSGVANTHTFKNGAKYPGMGQIMLPHFTVDTHVLTYTNAVSAAVDVVAGDYFELRVHQTDTVARELMTDDQTWFEITVAE